MPGGPRPLLLPPDRGEQRLGAKHGIATSQVRPGDLETAAARQPLRSPATVLTVGTAMTGSPDTCRHDGAYEPGGACSGARSVALVSAGAVSVGGGAAGCDVPGAGPACAAAR